MFNDVKTDSSQRITEIREYIDFLVPLFPNPPASPPRHLNTSKGLVFVQLYGVIEFTINSTVEKTLDLINSNNIKIQDMDPHIWSMALDPLLEALYQVKSKKWNKRNTLFKTIKDNELLDIATSIMPTDGGNCSIPQLKSIWTTFNINDPLFDDVTFRGRLVEIVTNRISIAHGKDSADTVGSRVTPQDLYDRLTQVSAYCSYFISVFESYISNKNYLKT